MTSLPISTHHDFVCGCEGQTDLELCSSCSGLPFYGEHEGRDYCVLHFPSSSKEVEFQREIERKLRAKDFNFRGVWFPSHTTYFQTFAFGAKADFLRATFNADAKFRGARFREEVDFRGVRFDGKADFSRSEFSTAIFAGTRFAGEASFDGADFNGKGTFQESEFVQEVSFSRAKFFEKPNFKETIFSALTNFSGAVFEAELRILDVTLTNVTFSKAKFKKRAYFYGTTFEQADFTNAVFSKNASFVRASFNGDTNFYRTTFCRNANFNVTYFSGRANFGEAKFNIEENATGESKFYGAIFKEAVVFSSAVFGGRTDFTRAVFENEMTAIRTRFHSSVSFRIATFMGDVRFAGDENRLVFDADNNACVFQYIRVDNPERVFFRTMMLHANWFVDADVRRFAFSDVVWGNSFNKEIKAARTRVAYPHRLLGKTCQEIALNAEENRRYPEASKFSYWALDLRRKEQWHGFVPWKLDWWYWLLSGYGERQLRAAAWLIAILLSFALLYAVTGFPGHQCGEVRECGRVMVTKTTPYSLGVMTLQRPEPRPDPGLLQMLVFLEGVFGPLQIALFALTLRRRYMR